MKTITMTLYKGAANIPNEEVIESHDFSDTPGPEAVKTVTCLMKMFARALQEDCDMMTIKISNDADKHG